MVSGEAPALFVRKATGLVRGWKNFDAFIYHYLVMNLVIAMYGSLSFSSFVTTGGSWLTAVLLTGIFVSFLCITYAGLVSVMPRAGGDYVWQSRLLSGGIGFVFAVTGWWFILWQWAPIYANILAVQLFAPLLVIFDQPEAASWIGSNNGIFVTGLITVVAAGFIVALGMERYAKVQKWSFWGGTVGLLIMFAILLFGSRSGFISAFNAEAARVFGDQGNAYAATIAAAKGAGVAPTTAFGLSPFGGATLLLIPFAAFSLLWPNWAAPLYGEVRGAVDVRRVLGGMISALWVSVLVIVVFLLLSAKTFGWSFYMSALAGWANAVEGAPGAVSTVWPYAPLWAGWYTHNQAVELVIVLLMGLWWVGWVGSLFLSSTRVIFAAAFDRLLPERAASVSERRHVPMGAVALMLIPSLVVTAMYAYGSSFRRYILDAVLVIAVTYMVTSLAAIILPWRRPEMYANSPIARYKVAGIPLLTLSGVITFAFLAFLVVYWFSNDGYFVNDPGSLVWMGILYVAAILMYLVAKVVRTRQGIDLKLIHTEIPVE